MVRQRTTPAIRLGLVVLAALATTCLTPVPAVASAKEKGGGRVNVAKTVNLPIPDAAPPGFTGLAGMVRSTIKVGKRFKGRRIRDVNVTVQTLGTSDKALNAPYTGPVEAIDLEAILRAPNGAQVTLFGFEQIFPPAATVMPIRFVPFPSLGPLTLDDEARLDLGVFNPIEPTRLYAPYAGTARPANKPLGLLDGGPVRGAWTLTMLDTLNTGTSTLKSWRLRVAAGKPFEAG